MSAEPADAELYALLHRGTPGDVAFYLRHARGRILELGCGSGRVLVPLLQAGHRITGLDIDADALALAANEAAELATRDAHRASFVHADMCDFSLDQRFERVFIPYNTLYGLGDAAQTVAALRCARSHLTPDGLVVFDAYAIDAYHAENEPELACDEDDDDAVPIVRMTVREWALDVYETTTWDRDAQRLEVHYRFASPDGTVIREQTQHHHYLLTEQIEPLCASAGLTVHILGTAFDGAPLTVESEHMICVAGRDDAAEGDALTAPT